MREMLRPALASDQMDPTADPHLKRVVTGAAVGTFVEWFDFAVYGYLAYLIAGQFFAQGDRTAELLATFAVFAIAFFARPLGGFFFGYLGDRYGRRTSLAICVLIMSASTGVIGLMPSFAQIGLWAPALLVLLRLAQGFSAGGEQSGAQTLLIEASPDSRRVWYGSTLQISQFLGQLSAALLVTFLAWRVSTPDMESWGWRIPFLAALPLGLIGLYIRMRIQDGEAYRTVAAEGRTARFPVREAFRSHGGRMATLFGFWIAIQVGFYLAFVFMPSYLIERGNIGDGKSLLVSSLSLGFLIVGLPFAARVADRIPRRRGLMLLCAGLAVVPWPAMALVGENNLATVIAAQLLMMSPFLLVPIAGVVTVELFPTRVRYTCSAVAYGTCTMLFGGTAPYIATYLVDKTGLITAPAIYLTCASIVSLAVVLWALPETKGTPLVRDQDTRTTENGKV